MVNEAVNGSNGHHGVAEDRLPLTKRLIGGDHDALALIAIGNEFKENGGFSFRLLDVAEVVNDDEVKTVELFESSLKLQLQFSLLQQLN